MRTGPSGDRNPRRPVPGMIAVLVARVAVAAVKMGVVDKLEQTVVTDDPVRALGHVGTQDEGGQLAVAVRGQRVVDVVQQRRNHQLLLRAVAVRPRRGLQRVLQPVDLVAGQRARQRAELSQHPVGGAGGELVLEPCEQLVILAGAVRHAGEAHRGGIRRRRRMHACNSPGEHDVCGTNTRVNSPGAAIYFSSKKRLTHAGNGSLIRA